jgi:dTDP-4-dehydrorhamnose reductase
MIVVFGGSGYLGSAFLQELKGSEFAFISPVRGAIDLTCRSSLKDYLLRRRASLVINAAGFTGFPNIDACERLPMETLVGNVILPYSICSVCAELDIPWLHVSSGCIYNGAKFVKNGSLHIERDLNRPHVRTLLACEQQNVRGFTEVDLPNFTFRSPPCSFYSGTKALAEAVLSPLGDGYICRLRLPFDEKDHHRNYLSKLQRYPKIYESVNSLSHRGDFAAACLDLFRRHSPYGTYNITNLGYVTTRQVVQMIIDLRGATREWDFWLNDEEFYTIEARAPRSNCILDCSKLLQAGIQMRTVEAALVDSLTRWAPEST